MSLSPILAPSGRIVRRDDGTLTINSLTTRCAAWWLLDLSKAWRYGDRRGSNRVILGAPGARAQRRLRTSTVVSFRMMFGGRYTSAGVATSVAPATQLDVNFAQARAAWVDDPGGDSTRTSTLIRADGTTAYTWPVQALDLDPGELFADEHDAVMKATLTIEIPRGGWVA